MGGLGKTFNRDRAPLDGKLKQAELFNEEPLKVCARRKTPVVGNGNQGPIAKFRSHSRGGKKQSEKPSFKTGRKRVEGPKVSQMHGGVKRGGLGCSNGG